ncbi:hypothetical protein PEJ38_004276 [Salmonella enterica]|nr:hypothetical protein [Salmonella enterica]
MAVKKRSQAVPLKKPADPDAIEALVSELADRPYGEAKSTPEPTPEPEPTSKPVVKKAKPISISLPPEVIQDLEDRVRANKLSEHGPRTVSGLIKEALKNSGYKI